MKEGLRNWFFSSFFFLLSRARFSPAGLWNSPKLLSASRPPIHIPISRESHAVNDLDSGPEPSDGKDQANDLDHPHGAGSAGSNSLLRTGGRVATISLPG